MKFFKKMRDKLFPAVFFLQAALNSFAQGDDSLLPTGMKTLMNQIQGVFTSDFVKAILICSLAGCAVAYGFNKDNEKMKRNIIAIAVACAILIASSEIIKQVAAATQG